MVSIRDVAREAGVSVSTVSKAMNGTGSLKEETRTRIREIAARLDYHPNAFARGLVSHRVENIGFMLDRSPELLFSNPFYSLVLEGIEEELVRRGFNLLIAAHSSYEESSPLPSFLRSRFVGGLILAGKFNPLFLERLARAKIPTILVDFYLENAYFDSIETDNCQGANLAVNYLVDKGHRYIACLVGNNEHPSIKDRVNTFLKKMEGIGVSRQKVYLGSGDVTPEGGYQAVQGILQFKPRPTAIFASNDAMAIGAMRYLRENRVRIPDEISIVGFDNIALSQHTDPPLTTVHVDKVRMGKIAAQRLIEIVTQKDLEKRRIILATRLIERKSVKSIRR